MEETIRLVENEVVQRKKAQKHKEDQRAAYLTEAMEIQIQLTKESEKLNRLEQQLQMLYMKNPGVNRGVNAISVGGNFTVAPQKTAKPFHDDYEQ